MADAAAKYVITKQETIAEYRSNGDLYIPAAVIPKEAICGFIEWLLEHTPEECRPVAWGGEIES